MTVGIGSYIRALGSISLNYLSVFVSVPYCLYFFYKITELLEHGLGTWKGSEEMRFPEAESHLWDSTWGCRARALSSCSSSSLSSMALVWYMPSLGYSQVVGKAAWLVSGLPSNDFVSPCSAPLVVVNHILDSNFWHSKCGLCPQPFSFSVWFSRESPSMTFCLKPSILEGESVFCSEELPGGLSNLMWLVLNMYP